MNPTPLRHVAYLDGWRGLAIIAVLIAHFGPKSTAWMGALGVQLFFVLSGYLMGGLLFIKNVPLTDFFARRFSRVVPTFLLFILAMALYAGTLQPRPYYVPMEELLPTVFFLRTYLPADLSIFAHNWSIGHLWSLNVEEHSYIFLALIALLARARVHKHMDAFLMVLSVAAVCAISALYILKKPDGASPWYLRSEVAALGLIASGTYRVVSLRFPAWFGSRFAMVFLSGLLLLALYAYWLEKNLWLRFILAPICLAYAVNEIHRAPKLIHDFLSAKILCWFGTCSFSLYLWQQPFFEALSYSVLPVAAAFIGALLCGSLSFYLFENPLRIYLNKKITSRNTMAAPQGSSLT